MVSIILSTFLLLFIFITFGLFLKKTVRLSTNLAEVFLLGMVGVNTLATWFSLFLPIDQYVVAFFVFISLLLVFYLKRELKEVLLSFKRNTASHYIILIFIPLALILTSGSPDNNDTALYHFQTIKWIEAFPVVPGLANLHGRFGFNPNVFILDALTSFKFIFNQEIFPLNFTVFLIIISFLFNRLYHLYNKNGFSNLFLFNFIILSFIISLPNLSSPAPDYLATVIPLYIFTRIINLSEEKTDFKKVLPLFFLAMYCLTIKLSTVPVMVIFLLIALKARNIGIRNVINNAPLAALIVLPWLIRNVILSGWLIYPFPSIDIFKFDWKVPISKVISEKEAVTGWARYPHASYPQVLKMGLKEWVPIWWNPLMLRWKLYIILGVLFPIISFLGMLTKRIKIDFLKFCIILTSFVGIIFWFIMAPDFRFGAAFILTASLSFLLFISFKWKPNIHSYSYFNGAIILLFFYYTYINRHDINKDMFHEMAYSNRLLIPQKIKIPDNRNFEKFPIKGGVVFVPSVSDQCYNHEIPCTPNYDSTLTLRGNSLKMGFKIPSK
jgi:hypothetical protein